MRRILILALMPFSVLRAGGGLESAQAALDDGLPDVAVRKIEEAFPGIAKNAGDPGATLLLARALLEAGRPADAAQILARGGKRLGRDGEFWLAQTQAALGRSEDALAGYRACAADPAFPLAREALVGEARMLRGLGQADAAASLLETSLSWPDQPVRRMALFELAEAQLARGDAAAAEKALDALGDCSGVDQSRAAFLGARVLALRGDDEGAIRKFSELAPLDGKMAAESLIGRANAQIRVGRIAPTEALLEEFIAERPNAHGLPEVFDLLDSIYAAGSPATSSELKRWADDNAPSMRRTLARFFLARQETRGNRPERAVKLLEKTVADGLAEGSVRDRARIELAMIRLREGRAEESLALLPAAGKSPAADYLRGLGLAARGNPGEAAGVFLGAASDPHIAESALFNAALCELLSGSPSRKAFGILQDRYPQSPKIEALRLQEAGLLARAGDPRAVAALKKLEDSPGSGVSGRAALALAGWNYEKGDYPAARLDLKRASTSADADPAQQAALAVFLEDTGNPDAEDAPITAARAFLAAHAGSAPEAEVRMKLGELLYRKGDYASARMELESLARKFPDSPLEEPALFLAAQATARLLTSAAASEAMLLFEEVASANGPLALRARFEQALLHNAQGRPKEAVVILDRILASKPDAETKASAQIEKGKTLYAVGASDPESFRSAIAVWKQLADDPAATPAARNQALARMGAAYEKLGDNSAAVACYYDTLKTPQGKVPEFFWFYKAGFAAARILEASQKWNEAVRIYEMMGAAEGPRSEEAKDRINKIRLENFLWDGR